MEEDSFGGSSFPFLLLGAAKESSTSHDFSITDSASRPMSQCWSVPAGDSSFWPELNLPVMNSLPARRNRPRVRHVMTDASPRNGHSSNQASVINCGSIVSRLEADDWITVLFWTGLDLVSSFPAPSPDERARILSLHLPALWPTTKKERNYCGPGWG